MVADHNFPDTDDIYHPSTNPQNRIAIIKERYRHLDIALAELAPGVRFNNRSHFDAPVPTTFLTSAYRGTRRATWFFTDFPCSGLPPFRWAGCKLTMTSELSPGQYHSLQYNSKYLREFNLFSPSLSLGPLSQGLCGSPIVHDDVIYDDASRGDVLGLFSLADQDVIENLFVRALDEIGDAGWEVDVENEEGEEIYESSCRVAYISIFFFSFPPVGPNCSYFWFLFFCR
jgi:hypothetical protein